MNGIYLYLLLFVTLVVDINCQQNGGTNSDCQTGEYYDVINNECAKCGQCKNDDPCDASTGLCPNGCKEWFYPLDRCTRYVEVHAPYLNVDYLVPVFDNVDGTTVRVCFYQNETLASSDAAQYYGYLIQYKKPYKEEYTDDGVILPLQAQQYVCRDIIGLGRMQRYNFRVSLVRVNAEGEHQVLDSSAISVTTTECENPRIPLIKTARPLPSLTAIYIKWEPVNSWDHKCRRYETVELWYRSTNDSTWILGTLLDTKAKAPATLRGLTPGWSYRLRVKVFNDAGLEAESIQVQVNLIAEELINMATPQPRDEGAGDANKDHDVISYVALAIGLAAMVLCIVAIILIVIIGRNVGGFRTPAQPNENHGKDGERQEDVALPERDAGYQVLGYGIDQRQSDVSATYNVL